MINKTKREIKVNDSNLKSSGKIRITVERQISTTVLQKKARNLTRQYVNDDHRKRSFFILLSANLINGSSKCDDI